MLVICDGELIARCIANIFRADLVAAQVGSGRQGFELHLPEGQIDALKRHVISVRFETTGEDVTNSPVLIERPERFNKQIERDFSIIVNGSATESDLVYRLDYLLRETDRLTQRLCDIRRADSPSAGDPTRIGPPDRIPVHQTGGARLSGPLRALVIDDSLPDPGRDGGSVAILSHIASLQRLGYHVSLVGADIHQCQADTNDSLPLRGVDYYQFPVFRSVEEVIRRQSDRYDLVYLHRLSNASRYAPIVRHHCPRAFLVYGIADLHHVRILRQGRVQQRPELIQLGSRTRLREFFTAWCSNVVLAHSAVEVATLQKHVPGTRVQVVPWAVPVRNISVPLDQRHGIVFIGAYSHSPNADAARWLACEIMPLIWKRKPEITCILVGHNLPIDVQQFASPRFIVMGAIDDLNTVFSQVRLSIAPLVFGAGIKGKVLESFSAGIPCVCTPVAAEGLALPAPLDAFVSETAAGLADLSIRLHEDLDLNRNVGHAAITYIESRHSEAVVDQAMSQAIAR